jgi:hypothetical protein
MRPFVAGLFLFWSVLFHETGRAQVYRYPTPAPEVTAASAEWQIDGCPVIAGGVVYYPTGGFRPFDGQVMVRVGLFQRVPIYTDVTHEPNSEVYVPVEEGRVRTYERRRDSVLDRNVDYGAFRGVAGVEATRAIDIGGCGVETASSDVRRRPNVGDTLALAPEPMTPTVMQSIPRPGANNGVWLEFNGARWYADGPATIFSPDRFEPVGEYRGFAVYRDKTREDGGIWVSVVKDGPVAPYSKR